MTSSIVKLWNPNFILAFLANFLMMMAFYMLMPTLPFYLIDTQHFDKSMVGIILSVYIISAVLVRPVSGYLIDTLNRKPFYVLVFMLFTASFGGYLLFTALGMLIVVRVVQGFIWGIIIPLGNTLAIDVIPSERRGSGIGFYGMSTNLAMALGPVVGLLLLEMYNFSAIVYIAIALCAVGVVLALFIRSYRKVVARKNEPISLDRFILVKAIPVGINILIVCFSYGVTITYAAIYGSEIGVGNPGLFFILMAAGVILSRLTTGRFIDRGMYNQIATVSIVILTVGFALLGLVKLPMVFFSMAFTVGFAYGMLFPAIQTMIVNFGTHHQRGTANSTYFTAFDIGVGLGMLFGGRIADVASFSVVFALSAGLNLAALVFYYKVSAPYFIRNKIQF